MHNPITFVTYDQDNPVTQQEYIREFLKNADMDSLRSEPTRELGVLSDRLSLVGFDNLAHEEFYYISEYHHMERALEAAGVFYDNPGVHQISFQDFCQVFRDYLAEKSA